MTDTTPTAELRAAAQQARAERADRAAIYAEVAERLATDAEQGDKEGLTRIYRRSAAKQVREWADELLRMAGETQPAETTEPEETDEERADREETERDHARGDHTHCGITCETEMPTEQLRNFVIAKGYPGTKGALDELLRRARAEGAVSAAVAPPTNRAELRDRIRRAICEAEGFMWNEELLEPDEYGEVADAVLAVLPEPADRAAIYAEVAERLATDAEQGDKDGLTRIYRRSAAKQVREWADRLRSMADETATETPAAVLTESERKMLAYALDQAQEHIWSRDGFTDEDQAAVDSLRRLTADEPAAGARQDGADQ